MFERINEVNSKIKVYDRILKRVLKTISMEIIV